jgi:hypothetical protein
LADSTTGFLTDSFSSALAGVLDLSIVLAWVFDLGVYSFLTDYLPAGSFDLTSVFFTDFFSSLLAAGDLPLGSSCLTSSLITGNCSFFSSS